MSRSSRGARGVFFKNFALSYGGEAAFFFKAIACWSLHDDDDRSKKDDNVKINQKSQDVISKSRCFYFLCPAPFVKAAMSQRGKKRMG